MQQQQTKNKDKNQIQYVEEDGKRYILEGKARIVTKKITQKDANTIIEEEVFYNPVQIFNRDMTVLVIETFAKQCSYKINILDALSASGLRSIRFAQELSTDLVDKIYANDLSSASLSLIKENVEANKIADRITINHMDANRLLYESALNVIPIKFDVIDLDPYGSVGPFLDAAIHACNNEQNRETLLCITCTDSRVLCGPDQQKCFSQYGTARVKMSGFAENGLRTLLYTISAAAAKLGKTIKPLLSIYGEFYLRVFVTVKRNKPGCHKLITQIGNAFVCPQCTAYWVYPYGQNEETDKKNLVYKINKQRLPKSQCEICDANLRINGPVWLDSINDDDFLGKMQIHLNDHVESFQTFHKIQGKLQGIQEQIRFEKIPYSYNFNWIASHLRCSNISKKEILYTHIFEYFLSSGVQSLNFDISSSYLQTDEFKTNCPPEAIFDIIKTWKQYKNPKENYLKNVVEGSYAHRVLTSEVKFFPDFTKQIQLMTHIKCFYPNPDKFWGPKQRALQKKIINIEEDEVLKKQKLT